MSTPKTTSPEYEVLHKREGKHPFEMLRPNNRLKAKVGEAEDFAPEALERAEEVVRELARDYINDLIYDVQELERNFHNFESNEGARRIAALKEIVWFAHEIKSQGGTFGYPFVSKVAGSLCLYMHELEERNAYDDLAKEIMRAHIDTLMVIARRRILGDGGEIGKLVTEGLQVCVKKHITRDPAFMKMDVKAYLSKLRSTLNKPV